MNRSEPVEFHHRIVYECAEVPQTIGSTPCDEVEYEKFGELLNKLGVEGDLVRERTTEEVYQALKGFLTSSKWIVCFVVEVRRKGGFEAKKIVLQHPDGIGQNIPTDAFRGGVDDLVNGCKDVALRMAGEMGHKSFCDDVNKSAARANKILPILGLSSLSPCLLSSRPLTSPPGIGNR